MRPPVHVLTLARLPERIAALGSRLDGLGIDWSAQAAIDRLEVPAADLVARFGVRRGFSATAGDMACSLGHLAIWRRIARDDAPVAVVLEDDAHADPALRSWLDRLPATMRGHRLDVLKLEAWTGPERSRRVVAGAPLEPGIWRLRSTSLGSAGYAITRETAARLAARFASPGMPVDHLLFSMLSPARLRAGFVDPAPVWQDRARFPSDISCDRPPARRRPVERLSRGMAHLRVQAGRAEWVRPRPASPVTPAGTD